MTSSQALMPATILTAAGSGRKLDLRHLPAPTLLLFHDQQATDAALAINLAVRKELPEAAHILVGSVPDLSSVPRLLRRVAQTAMDKGFHDGAKRLSANLDPADYILILPDWDGALTQFTGFVNVGSNPGMLLVGPTGQILGKYQGVDPAQHAVDMLGQAGLVAEG